MLEQIEKEQDFNNFDGEYKIVNGKKVLVVKAKHEEITNPDGTKDVIIHVPTLNLFNKALK